METTGEITREIRTKESLTQDEFGAAIGVTKQAVNNWEKDKWKPNAFLLLSTVSNFTDYRREWAIRCLDAHKAGNLSAPAPTLAQSYPTDNAPNPSAG